MRDCLSFIQGHFLSYIWTDLSCSISNKYQRHITHISQFGVLQQQKVTKQQPFSRENKILSSEDTQNNSTYTKTKQKISSLCASAAQLCKCNNHFIKVHRVSCEQVGSYFRKYGECHQRIIFQNENSYLNNVPFKKKGSFQIRIHPRSRLN